MKYNKWHLWVGALIGILGPLITFTLLFFSTFKDKVWLNVLTDHPAVIRPFIQLSVIPNLALFFLFLMLNLERISRGILLSTILFGLYVLYITFN